MTPAASSYFTTAPAGLRRKTISGGMAAAAGQVVTFALHFGSIAVLARLLGPGDFGVVAMVTAVTGFMALFGDSGLSLATVQRERITHAQVSTLFWINLGLGVALAALTAALGPALAWFYGEPQLTAITAALAGGFVLRGLGVQHQALLRRNLQFPRLVLVSTFGALAGYTAGITAALRGLGHWSLVVQALVMAGATTLAAWLACPWRPGAPARDPAVAGMAKFGGAFTGSTVMNYLLRNFDNLLVGWYWGASALGYYSRGYAIMMLPMGQLNGPINQVALPALSRAQSDPEKFARGYFQGVTLLAGVSLPACVLLMTCAEPFVLTVLGEKWRDIVPILLALAPAAALSTITNAAGWAYNALGQAGRQLRWTLGVVPVYLAGFAIALPFGPVAVAASFSLLLSLLFLPTFWFAYRGTPLRVKTLTGVLLRPVAAALLAGAVTTWALRAASVAALVPPAQLALGTILFAVAYVAGWFHMPGGREQILSTWRYIASAFRRESPA
jgi:O-antigen/teichoic acid export membrane protein